MEKIFLYTILAGLAVALLHNATTGKASGGAGVTDLIRAVLSIPAKLITALSGTAAG